MTTHRPPEELDTQAPDKPCGVEFQLFTSLLRFGSGWFANHAVGQRAGSLLRLFLVQEAAAIGELTFRRFRRASFDVQPPTPKR